MIQNRKKKENKWEVRVNQGAPYLTVNREGRISNASGTRSVRVNAQRLSRSCCKLSPVKISSPQLAAPGCLRMRKDLNFNG